MQFRGARGSLKRKRNRDDREAKQKEAIKPVIVPDEPISVGALAELQKWSGGRQAPHAQDGRFSSGHAERRRRDGSTSRRGLRPRVGRVRRLD